MRLAKRKVVAVARDGCSNNRSHADAHVVPA